MTACIAYEKECELKVIGKNHDQRESPTLSRVAKRESPPALQSSSTKNISWDIKYGPPPRIEGRVNRDMVSVDQTCELELQTNRKLLARQVPKCAGIVVVERGGLLGSMSP